MGEYAEMMLDGTCCAGCGEYLFDDGGDGIPRYCSPECSGEDVPFDADVTYTDETRPYDRPFKCDHCDKRFKKKFDRHQHQRDAHPSLDTNGGE